MAGGTKLHLSFALHLIFNGVEEEEAAMDGSLPWILQAPSRRSVAVMESVCE